MRRAEALRDKIEQDIVTGRFQPGERLDEQSLADRFGVSRTPIREALMQLASTGMVELHSRRGAFVASLGLKEIIERFEAMAALEGMCGALAARRITDEQRAMLPTRNARTRLRTAPQIPTTTPTIAFIKPSMRLATTPIWQNRLDSFTTA